MAIQKNKSKNSDNSSSKSKRNNNDNNNDSSSMKSHRNDNTTATTVTATTATATAKEKAISCFIYQGHSLPSLLPCKTNEIERKEKKRKKIAPECKNTDASSPSGHSCFSSKGSRPEKHKTHTIKKR